jgi:hypothetical protein
MNFFFSLFVTDAPCGQTAYAYDVSIIIIRSQAQGFDHKKSSAMPNYAYVVRITLTPCSARSYACEGHLFLLTLLLIFVTAYSFCKLLFTFEGGQGVLF